MSIGGSSGPSPAATAQAQAQANQQAMLQSILGSQVNQVTPFGNLTYSGSIPIVDPETGQVTSYVNTPTAGNFQGQQPVSPAANVSPMAGAGTGFLGPNDPNAGGQWIDNRWVPYPSDDRGGAPSFAGGGTDKGVLAAEQEPFSPRTMTIELSPHGQYMQQGQENISKALLDLASRMTTQVQSQPAFSIAGLGLPPQVTGLGATSLLSRFSPAGAASMPQGVSQLAQALMGGGR